MKTLSDFMDLRLRAYSFKSQRYFGKEHKTVRKTRLIRVLPQEADNVHALPQLADDEIPQFKVPEVSVVACTEEL